jgi:hypothetical protein
MRTGLHLCVAIGLLTTLMTGVVAAQTVDEPPDRDDERSDSCIRAPSECGMTVALDDTFAGPNNSMDCLTNRVVYLPNGTNPSDYIAVCGDGETAVPDGFGEDGNPICTPFSPGRLPPVFAQTTLPTGQIEMNPDPEALTGLESWFWYDGPTTHTWQSPVHEGRTADCLIIPAPAPITYTATLTGYRYTIDDSRPARVDAHHAGNREDPAARHTYRTKGEWPVAVTCTWTAGSVSVDLDCADRTVPVTSVRAVRTS